VRHLRKPLWLGAVASFGATIITFMVMRGIVNAFASFGERLEVIVSLIAIGVLLLIMNWFFHQVYWNEHLASFHKQKHQLAGVAVGQTVGLFLLGFTALYREGFETALFLQSLVLQSDVAIVTLGSLAALVLVAIIGALVFLAQTKLPHKKMLVFTGLMMCVVLGMMVGNTVHKMQIVGWMPIHPLPVEFPYWFGMWLGTYATLEGIALQIIAVTAVIGSYFLAENMKHKDMRRKAEQPQMT
jgi:high-affinity iron transporter